MTITKSFIPLVDEKTYTIDTQKKLKITMKHHTSMNTSQKSWMNVPLLDLSALDIIVTL